MLKKSVVLFTQPRILFAILFPLLFVMVITLFAVNFYTLRNPARAAYVATTTYTLTVQNTDPSLNTTINNFQSVFHTSYPQLVSRFAHNPATAPRNILLTFSTNMSAAASTSNNVITINQTWIQQHPNDYGLISYMFAAITFHYPSTVPAWFTSGMANYVRSTYGPPDDFSLPATIQPGDSYTGGYSITARFLLWLSQHQSPAIIDQLNHAAQSNIPITMAFQQITHYTLDQLWVQYSANPVVRSQPAIVHTQVKTLSPISPPIAPTPTPTPTPTPIVTPTPTPASSNTITSSSVTPDGAMTTEEQYAQAVLQAINTDRASAGLPALNWNIRLVASAHQHNLVMAAANTMEHQIGNEPSLGARISAQGVTWTLAEENIGYNPAYTSVNDVLILHQDMMAEQPPDDGHRQNILNNQVTDIGIDCYIDLTNYKIWLTEDFAH